MVVALEVRHVDQGPFNMFHTTDVGISKAKFLAVFGEVFERTFIPSGIIESFRKRGIFPLKRHSLKKHSDEVQNGKTVLSQYGCTTITQCF